MSGVGVLALLAAARAHADWRENTALPEPPNDVLEVWGPETFSVGFENGGRGGAYLVVDGGVAQQNQEGAAVGTFYNPGSGCFVSILADGRRYSLGADGGTSCGGIQPSPPVSTGETLKRVKHAVGGGSALVTTNGSDHQLLFLSQRDLDAPVFPITRVGQVDNESAFSVPFAVARVDDKVHSLIGASLPSPQGLWDSLDAGSVKAEGTWAAGDSSVGPAVALELFAVNGSPYPVAVVGAQRALFQGPPDSASGKRPQEVHRLGPGEQLLGVSMNVEAGGDGGYGFGMALVKQADGGTRVLSPVPMESRGDAGTVWRPRELPPFVRTAALRQVACHGAAFCAFTAPGQPAHNLILYANAAPPEISVYTDAGTVLATDAGGPARVELDENSHAVLMLAASDRDGDPVRLTASREDVLADKWAVTSVSADAGEPIMVTVDTRAVCRDSLVGTFDTRASDGLGAHDTQRDIDVYVRHTVNPQFPQVNRADGTAVPPQGALAGELEAGGGALKLEAVDSPPSLGCQWAEQRWTPDATEGPTLEADGGTAWILPPRTFCEAGGRDFSFTLAVTDEGGRTSTRSFPVRQRPWGIPERVFGPPPSGREDPSPAAAGAPVELVPAPFMHACQRVSGFPGVVTSWNVTLGDGGTPDPEGFSFQKKEGGVITGFPVEAEGLAVRRLSCQPAAALSVHATHSVKRPDGTRGPSGPESQRDVWFAPAWKALSEGTLDVTPAPGAAGLILNTNLDCGTQRHLRAELRLEPVDPGGSPWSGAVALPGLETPWTAPRSVACGHYQMQAALADDSVQDARPPVEPVGEVVLPGAGVALRPAPPQEMTAVCGEGASIPLSALARPTPGFCQTPDYTWTHEDGPALEQTSTPEGAVVLTTVSKALDELIGRPVKVGVVASKGGERAELPVEVRITVEPFIRVDRRTELPAAAETELVGVLVHLTNTTACDVSDVGYEERLEGLSFMGGSAKLDGEFVDAGTAEDALTVTLPHLAAGATRTLSYVARPHLLGERRMRGEATKNRVLLSTSDGDAPRPSGCGCTQAGAGPWLLALAALARPPRRRRRP